MEAGEDVECEVFMSCFGGDIANGGDEGWDGGIHDDGCVGGMLFFAVVEWP